MCDRIKPGSEYMILHLKTTSRLLNPVTESETSSSREVE